MKKKRLFALGISMILSCAACNNSGSINYGYGKEKSRFTTNIDQVWIERGVDEFLVETQNSPEDLKDLQDEMMKIYGQNKEIVASYDANLAAKTPYGTYVGKKDKNNVISWKGIPYAKAPIKDLRWKTPQNPDKSDKIYQAYYFGKTALQMYSFDESSSLYPQGEECLNLNIWNNASDTSNNKPIMVWIHGGAYISGGASDLLYEGTNFVITNPNVIFASIDYRTCFLGFVNLSDVPGGEKYKESANLGLLDQVAALKWLKENATAFGGDPDRITIFGESAGGGSVSALTLMPSAKGLFKRAIIESGSASDFLRTAEKSKQLTQEILEITGAKTINDLLELTPNDIQKVCTILCAEGTSAYTFPQLDGIALPLDLKSQVCGDVRNGIDILSGTTKDEYEYWSYILGPELNQLSMLNSISTFSSYMNEDEAARYNQFKNNLDCSSYKKNIESINYFSFHSPCRFEARTHAENGQKVYQYFFTEEINAGYIDPSTQEYQGYGAMHASELPYLFGNLVSDDELCCTHDEAVTLSNIIQKMWVNFALNGNPSVLDNQVSGANAITWDPYTLDNNNVMILNAKGCKQELDPLKENVDILGDIFWCKLR